MSTISDSSGPSVGAMQQPTHVLGEVTGTSAVAEDASISENVLKDGRGAKASPSTLQAPPRAPPLQLQEDDVWSLLMDSDWKNKLRSQLEERLKSKTETVEERGFKEVDNFTDQTVALVDRLGKVINVVLRISPSSAIGKSNRNFRDVLLALLYDFTENGHSLFPGRVEDPHYDPFFESVFRKINAKGRGFNLKGSVSSTSSSHYPPADITNETFIVKLEMLAGSIASLFGDVHKFMDYMKVTVNEELTTVNDALCLFEENLNYWAGTAKVTNGIGGSALYKHNLMLEIGEHLSDISHTLDKLLTSGLPKIEDDFKEAQKVAQTESLALLTVATFFTSVTASTLGFSVQQTSVTYHVVNFFWFCSLIFSIASVMNSLLAYSWKHSIYRKRSSDDELPWLISIWSKETPLYFLVISAMLFTVGLCLFAYASNQSRWTSAVTTIMTGLSAIGIAGATAWFILEYHSIEELWQLIKKIREKIGTKIAELREWFRNMWETIWGWFDEKSPRFTSSCRKVKMLCVVPFALTARASRTAWQWVCSLFKRIHDVGKGTRRSFNGAIKRLKSLPPISRHNSTAEPPLNRPEIGHGDGTSVSDGSNPEKLLSPASEHREDSTRMPMLNFSSASSAAVLMKRWRSAVAGKTSVQESPVDSLVKALKSVRPKSVATINAHASTGCIVFSPDSKFIGACSSSTASFYRTSDQACVATLNVKPDSDERFTSDDPLAIAWSPRSSHILLNTRQGVTVYKTEVQEDESGIKLRLELMRTIDMSSSTHLTTSLLWLPQGEAFVAVNGSSVKTFEISSEGDPITAGTVSHGQTSGDEELTVEDVVYIGRKPRLIVLATVVITSNGTKLGSHKSKTQNQIIIYDLEKREVESRIPLFDRPRNISLSKDESVAVIGFMDKPPQLWQVDGNDRGSDQALLRMFPRRIYESTLKNSSPDLCIGRTFFFGNNDELVICWDYYHDEFHIWDREFAVPLSIIDYWYQAGSIQSMSVSRAHQALMFATASFGGDITFWRPSKGEESNENGDEDATGEVSQELGSNVGMAEPIQEATGVPRSSTPANDERVLLYFGQDVTETPQSA